MAIKTKIRSNIIVILASSVFCLWMLFLFWTFTHSSRDPYFYDYISGQDVTSEYTSEISLLRYIIEPFVGISFTMGIGTLLDELDIILITFLIAFVLCRIIYLVIARGFLRRNKKKEIIQHHVRNVFNCFWKYTGLIFLIGLLILFVGWKTQGFLFINHYWMDLMQIWIIVGCLLFFGKITQNLVAFAHSSLRFKIKRVKKWKSLPKRSPKYGAHKFLEVLGREPRYFLSALLIFIIGSATLTSIQFPTQKITTNLEEGEILMDFHCHTTESDGWITPEERVDWYIEQGIHAAAFSDHQTITGAVRAREYVERNNLNFTVFIAQEYTTYDIPERPGAIHLNVYGIEEDYSPIEFVNDSFSPNCLNVSDMIQNVKSRGGFVTVNHYKGSGGYPYTYEELRDWGVDGFEIINSGHLKASQIRQFCLDNNLSCLAATDAHMNPELNSFVKLKLDDPNNMSLAHIFEVLKRNEHQAIAVSYQENEIDIVLPSFIENVDLFQHLSWAIWSIISFIAFLLVYRWIKRKDYKKMASKIMIDPKKRFIFFKSKKERKD